MKKLIVSVSSAILIALSISPTFVARAGTDPAALPLAFNPVKTLYLRVTAYSSSPDETDSSPFYTANGTFVHDGIIATNLLPFGTRVMIPALFGSKVFTVEDRMAKRFSHSVDIWMPSKMKALFFGVNYADMVVLGKTTEVAEK